MQKAPEAFEDETLPKQTTQATMPNPASPTLQEHRAELLPAICSQCGGPILGHEVKWTGTQSADCPYCGANLPMKNG